MAHHQPNPNIAANALSLQMPMITQKFLTTLSQKSLETRTSSINYKTISQCRISMSTSATNAIKRRVRIGFKHLAVNIRFASIVSNVRKQKFLLTTFIEYVNQSI